MSPPPDGTDRATRRLAFALAALEIFIGLGGVGGGVGLILSPSGASLGMSPEALSASPFSDFLIPGYVLLAVNGVGSLIGGALSCIRYRHAGLLGAALGTFLMLWIVAQVWWIGLVHWLQPLYFVLGGLELALGLLLHRSLCTGRQQPSEAGKVRVTA